MHLELFAERTGLAHQYAAALTQRTIDGFDDARAAIAFGAAAVPPAGQYAHVGGEQVGKVPTMPSVAAGQRLPQAPGGGGVAVAQHPGDDAAAGALDRQPEPHLAPPLAHKRPHLVEFKGLPRPALGFFRPPTRQGRAGQPRFFSPVWPRSSGIRRWPARCCVASCARPAAFPLARNELPARPLRAQNALGGRRFCTGTWRGPGCCHCAECAYCRSQRRGVACKP